jgi:hypothetical protein
LTTQGCNNIVISRLHRTCWNNLATSLIIPTRLLQLHINKLFQTCWQLGTLAVRTQLVDGLLANLLQDVRSLHAYRRNRFSWKKRETCMHVNIEWWVQPNPSKLVLSKVVTVLWFTRKGSQIIDAIRNRFYFRPKIPKK